MQHLLRLLDAFDEKLVRCSLDCLVELALPPQSHRSEHFVKRHSTALQKHPPALQFSLLFDALLCHLHATNASHDGLICIERPVHSLAQSDGLGSGTVNWLFAPSSPATHTQSFSISVTNIQADLYKSWILRRIYPEGWSGWQLRVLLWQLRMHYWRSVGSSQAVYYQILAVIVHAYPHQHVLSSFLQERVMVLSGLVEIIVNPPYTTVAATPARSSALYVGTSKERYTTYRLACSSLEGLSEARDFGPPLSLRQPWLLHALGLQRGQYLGSIPSLLRGYVERLLMLESLQGTVVEEEEEVLGLLCLESLAAFLLGLSNSPVSVVPSLVDGGCVDILLQFISLQSKEKEEVDGGEIVRRVPLRNAPVVFAACALSELLETILIHHSGAATIFRELNGVEVVFDRLLFETQRATNSHCLPHQTLPFPRNSNQLVGSETNIYIEELLSLMLSYIQEGRPESADNGLQALFRSRTFLELFYNIFSAYELFSHAVLISALSLLVEVLQRDSAPPTMVNYVLCAEEAHGLALLDCLLLRPLQAKIFLKSDFSVLYMHLLSALSITEAGLQFVLQSQALHMIITSVVLDPDYYLPHSRLCMHGDLVGNLGGVLEEIVRHFPAYIQPVVDGLLGALRSVYVDLSVAVGLCESQEEREPLFWIDHARYVRLLWQLECVLGLCESVLVRGPVIAAWQAGGGLDLLLGLSRRTLGPRGSLLAALACMTDQTLHTLGYIPAKAALLHILTNICESAPNSLWDASLLYLNDQLKDLRDKAFDYRCNYICKTESANAVNKSIDESPFAGLLESLPREPLHNLLSAHLDSIEATMPPQLRALADLLSACAALASNLEIWGLIVAGPDVGLPHFARASSPSSANKRVFQTVDSVERAADVVKLLEQIIAHVLIPIQAELANAKAVLTLKTPLNIFDLSSDVMLSLRDTARTNQTSTGEGALEHLLPSAVELATSSPVSLQPIYVLMVLADQVSVRAGPEDSARKVYRVYKGQLLRATSRCLGNPLLPTSSQKDGGSNALNANNSNNQNSLKYELEDGCWISVYKSASSPEPQVLVLALERKTPEALEKEAQAVLALVRKDPRKRSELEKVAGVSVRRAGFLACFHLYNTVELFVLQTLTKAFLSKPQTPPGGLQALFAMPGEQTGSCGWTTEGAHARFIANEMTLPLLRLLSATLPSKPPAFSSCEPYQSSGAVLNSEEEVLDLVRRLCSTTSASSVCLDRIASDSLQQELAHYFFMSIGSSVPGFGVKCFAQMDELPSAYLPTYCECSIDVLYRYLRSLELLQTLLFDATSLQQRRGNRESEINIVLLLRLLQEDGDEAQSNFWHELLWGTVLICGCLYSPLSLSNPALTRFQAEVTFPPGWELIGEEMGDAEAYGILISQHVASPPLDCILRYLKYRSLLRERQQFARANLEVVVNFLRLFFVSLSSQVSVLERGLHFCTCAPVHGEGTFYDPFYTRRRYLLLLSRYMPLLWAHRDLASLPVDLQRCLVDLMVCSMRALQDATKGQPIRLVAPDGNLLSVMRQRPVMLRERAQAMRSTSSAPDTGITGPSSGAGVAAVNTGLSQSQPLPSSGSSGSSQFVVNEATVALLRDMGFERNLIVRAMTLSGSNDANALAQFLLENAFMLETLERQSTHGNSNRTNNSSAPEGVPPNIHNHYHGNSLSSDPSSEVNRDRAEIAADSSSNDGVNASAGLSSVDTPSPAVILFKLPAMARRTETELRRVKDLVAKALLGLYPLLPLLFIHCCVRSSDMISVGSSTSLTSSEESGTDDNRSETPSSSSVSYMLQAVVRVLDKYQLSDVSLRLVPMSWLQARLHTLCEKSRAEQLAGPLQALALLLHSRAIPSQGNNTLLRTGSNRPEVQAAELHFLLLAMDERWQQGLQSLLDLLLSRTAGFWELEDRDCNWLTASMLYLALACQPIFVSSLRLRTFLRDAENQRTFINDLQALQAWPSGLISVELKREIAKTFLPADLSQEERQKNPWTMGQDEIKTEEKTADVPLPFLLGCLSEKQRLQALDIALRILRNFSSPSLRVGKATGGELLHATYALLHHLLTSEAVRQSFLASSTSTTSSNFALLLQNSFTPTPRAALLPLLSSLFQRALEEPSAVLTHMNTTLRLAFNRLSLASSTSSGATVCRENLRMDFRALLEGVRPLVQRDPILFLQALQATFHFEVDRPSQRSNTTGNAQQPVLMLRLKTPLSQTQASQQNEKSSLCTIAAEEGESSQRDQQEVGQVRSRSHSNPTASPVSRSMKRPRLSGQMGGSQIMTASISLQVGTSGGNLHSVLGILVQQIAVRSLLAVTACSSVRGQASSKAKVKEVLSTLSTWRLSDSLLLLADLVCAQPTAGRALQNLRLQYPNQHIPTLRPEEWLLTISPPMECDDEHLLGKKVTLNCTSFLHLFLDEILPLTYELSSREKNANLLANSPLSSQEKEKVEKEGEDDDLLGAVLGSAAFDRACYLFAALCSRPGIMRRDILGTYLQRNSELVTLNSEDNGTGVTGPSFSQLRRLACFAETLCSLLHPPRQWAARETFLLPVTDLHHLLCTSLCAVPRLVATITALPLPGFGGNTEYETAIAVCRSALCAALDVLTRRSLRVQVQAVNSRSSASTQAGTGPISVEPRTGNAVLGAHSLPAVSSSATSSTAVATVSATVSNVPSVPPATTEEGDYAHLLPQPVQRNSARSHHELDIVDSDYDREDQDENEDDEGNRSGLDIYADDGVLGDMEEDEEGLHRDRQDSVGESEGSEEEEEEEGDYHEEEEEMEEHDESDNGDEEQEEEDDEEEEDEERDDMDLDVHQEDSEAEREEVEELGMGKMFSFLAWSHLNTYWDRVSLSDR